MDLGSCRAGRRPSYTLACVRRAGSAGEEDCTDLSPGIRFWSALQEALGFHLKG